MTNLTGEVQATDNCGNTTLEVTQNITANETLDLGNHYYVSVTATDHGGNSKDCATKLTVVDKEKASITCPATQTTLLATTR
jgi:hypothetical protein